MDWERLRTIAPGRVLEPQLGEVPVDFALPHLSAHPSHNVSRSLKKKASQDGLLWSELLVPRDVFKRDY